MADDPILPYFSPRHAAGRSHLATVAVGLALIAIPGLFLVVPGLLLALAAIVMGAIAGRFIKEEEEPIAHRRAHTAAVLGFLELIIGGALVLALFFRT